MKLTDKLEIFADAAKYDASCASSGAPRRGSKGKEGIGATDGMGICHSYTPDGRCVSLHKILLTNFCIYGCQYCVNRRSSDVPRARFSVAEVVASRLVELRQVRRIRYADLARLRCSMKKAARFIATADYTPGGAAASSEALRRSLAPAPQQMNLWSDLQAA